MSTTYVQSASYNLRQWIKKLRYRPDPATQEEIFQHVGRLK